MNNLSLQLRYIGQSQGQSDHLVSTRESVSGESVTGHQLYGTEEH